MSSISEILDSAKVNRLTGETTPVVAMVDGKPLGRQMGRLQKSITMVGRNWIGEQVKYEEHIRKVVAETLQHALDSFELHAATDDNGEKKDNNTDTQ